MAVSDNGIPTFAELNELGYFGTDLFSDYSSPSNYPTMCPMAFSSYEASIEAGVNNFIVVRPSSRVTWPNRSLYEDTLRAIPIEEFRSMRINVGSVTIQFTADYYTTNYGGKFYYTNTYPNLTFANCGMLGEEMHSMHKLSDGKYECYLANSGESWRSGYYYFYYDGGGGYQQYLRYAVIFNLSSSNVNTLNEGTSLIINAYSVVGLNPQ